MMRFDKEIKYQVIYTFMVVNFLIEQKFIVTRCD